MELGGRWPRARRSADQILEMYVGRGRVPVDNYHFLVIAGLHKLHFCGFLWGLFSNKGEATGERPRTSRRAGASLATPYEMTPPNKEGRLTSKRSAAIQRGAEKMFSEARLAMIDGLQTRPAEGSAAVLANDTCTQ